MHNNINAKIIAASGHLNLANLLAAFEAAGISTATVEAEYGDVCVEGSWATLAHHGSRSANPVPCVLPNRQDIPASLLVGISHLDLDTLGGVLGLLGAKPEAEEFWAAAARVDVEGPHMLPLITQNGVVLAQLHAFWAWSESNRLVLPRDGAAVDVTGQVFVAADALAKILGGDSTLLAEGQAWAARRAELATSTLRGVRGPVAFRVGEVFLNHLYSPSQTAIVGYNPTKGIITASLVDDTTHGDADVAQILKGFFGPEAGGRKTVGGGPRDLFISPAEAEEFWAYMAQIIMGSN